MMRRQSGASFISPTIGAVPSLAGRYAFALLSTLAWGLFVPTISAWGQPPIIVSANFFDSGTPRTGPMFDGISGVNFTAGVPGATPNVREDNWNDLDGTNGLRPDLQDSNASPTSVDVSWAGTDNFANFYVGGGSSDGDATLMNGQLASQVLGQAGTVTVLVSDLANTYDLNQGYDVYVYVDTEDTGSMQEVRIDDFVGGQLFASVTDNNDDIDDAPPNDPLPFVVPNDYDDATFDGVGTFVVFRGLTGPTFELSAMSAADFPAYINGFQIAGFAIPEPGCLTMFILGGIGLLATRPSRSRC